MLLEHVGEIEKERRISQAIAAVVEEGRVRTYDMMRIPGGAKAISQGAASTVEMTDAVLEKLAQQAHLHDSSKGRTELAEVGSSK